METNMDKSWINLPRVDPRYIQGIIDFMEFACKNIPDQQTEIACPCKKCHNMARKNIDLVKQHLVVDGFTPSYTVWIFHGEKSQPTNCGVENSGCGNFNGQDEMQEMVRDAFGIPPIQAHDIDLDPPLGDGHNFGTPLGDGHNLDEETIKFFKLLKEADRELYPGCTRGLGLGATESNLLGAKNNDQAPSQSSIERDRQFMKMKSKVQKMKRFLEAMGYTDDTDDDSDEFNEAPNENHPDASSAHREMTIGNNQASPEEINLAHRSQPEPTPFPRPNQQADSHHQCEPGSTAAPDLAMWKQAEASRNARKTTRVTNKKRRTSQNGSN